MSDGQEGTGVQVLLPANCVRMPVVWFENGFDDHARVCWFCFPSASRFFFFLLLLLLLLLPLNRSQKPKPARQTSPEGGPNV